MTSYGCWCQLRNWAAGGMVAGKNFLSHKFIEQSLAKICDSFQRKGFRVKNSCFVVFLTNFTGHGAPMDELDEFCKAWSQCRSCTSIDDTTCNPDEEPYEVRFDPATQRVDCQFNDNDCAINTCKCDEQLAHSMVASIADMNNEFISNPNGSGFDHAFTCKAANNPNAPDINNGGNGNGGNSIDGSGVQCCGAYPNRFSFNTNEGAKSCCGDVTYNTSKHDCCNNSFLAAIGECN